MTRRYSIVCKTMIGLVWATFEEWGGVKQGCHHIIDLRTFFIKGFEFGTFEVKQVTYLTLRYSEWIIT